MSVEEGEEVVLYGNGFWEQRIGNETKSLSPKQKIHLVYSLMVFLSVTLVSFLEFYFTSTIVEVRQRAKTFMAYRPTNSEDKRFSPSRIFSLWYNNYPTAKPYIQAMVQECALDIALQESTNIIQDESLQIRMSTLTIQGMRELLTPSAIQKKYKEHAPFVWRMLMVFSSSPNRYRRENLAEEDRDVDMDGSSTVGSTESDDNGRKEKDVPSMPAGFSRNPVLVVIITIAMLTFVRNRATNIMPLLLGLFFKVNGTSTRVIQMLSNIGLSVSESTIERLKEDISNDAIRLAVDYIKSGHLFFVIFDNINIYLRKFQQRLTNQNSMIHATNAAIIAIDEEGMDPAVATDMETFLSLRGGRSKAVFDDITPTVDDGEHMKKAFQGHIARLLVRYCPGSEEWENRKEMLTEIDKMIPQDRPLQPHKTRAFPFGVFNVNEGSKKGLVQVLEKIRERTTIPIQKWVSKVKVICGDWLTSANFRGARRDRSDDINSMERLEYGFPLSTLWHYALQATHMIMRTHYGHSVVEDPTCLRAHKDLLHRTWDANKPNYAAAKALIRHSLIARLLNIVMVYRKLKTWKGLSHWRPTLQDIRKLSETICNEFATTAAAERAKANADDWMAHSIYFIRDALLFIEFEDAVAHADAGRVLRVLRYWCFAYRGAGQHNYARECAEVLLQWKYETTAELRKLLERSWFYNRWGLPGRWIAADLYIEQLNFWIKRVLIAHGNGVTIEYIMKKGSACIEAFRDVTHLVSNFFGDSDRSRRSKEAAFQKDLEALVDEMVNRKVHQPTKTKRVVYAPPPKPKKTSTESNAAKKTPYVPRSAIVDVQVLGAEVWQAGKFTEFIKTTAWDPAVKSYPLTGASDTVADSRTELPATDTAFDNSENPLEFDTMGDIHGDEYGNGSSALGGGGEYWTGNMDDVTD